MTQTNRQAALDNLATADDRYHTGRPLLFEERVAHTLESLAWATAAVAQATLEVAEQQRIANLITISNSPACNQDVRSEAAAQAIHALGVNVHG